MSNHALKSQMFEAAFKASLLKQAPGDLSSREPMDTNFNHLKAALIEKIAGRNGEQDD